MDIPPRAHYLQHVDFEGPGFIATWLGENGFEIEATRLYEPTYSFPDPANLDLLIIMGGPMGIFDETDHEWLIAEKAFIKKCITAGKKVLGICLGAQLIADALGASVHKAPYKEIGWFRVQDAVDLANEGTLKACFDRLFKEEPMVFHWHGDQFDIPAGCQHLLVSAANIHQAFILKNQVVGLQFHLEITKDQLNQMVEMGSSELASAAGDRYVQQRDLILQGSHQIESCNQLMGRLLEYWLLEL